MSQNNLLVPGRAAVKAYGHDLQALVTNVESTARTRGHALSSAFPSSTLCASVLAFLSEFANGMRYANLDALATGTYQRDPLNEWNSILQMVAAHHVRSATRQRVVSQAAGIAHALGGNVAVIANDLSGKPLTAMTVHSESTLLDHASKHIVWELVTLLCPLRDVVIGLGMPLTKSRSRVVLRRRAFPRSVSFLISFGPSETMSCARSGGHKGG